MADLTTTSRNYLSPGQRRVALVWLALLGVALVVMVIAALIARKQPAPVEIELPRMQNAPPPSQRLEPRER